MYYKYLTTIWVIVFTMPIFLGCGPSRPETATVTGKITFQGKPVPEGTIIFYPENGRSASGRIQADGTYTLTTFEKGDGAILGNHTVTIEAVRFPQGAQPKSLEEEIAMGKKTKSQNTNPVWFVPQQYADQTTSNLTAKVTSGSNTIDFKLPK